METSTTVVLPARANTALNVLWMLAVGVGALAIYLANGQWHMQLVIPLVLMVAYSIYGQTLRLRNPQRFADSLYFMGFLWTVIALAAATMRISGTGGEAVTGATLAQLFGYAVITTGAGMFLRVAVLNSHPDHDHVTDDQRAMAQLRQVYEHLIATMVHGGTQFDGAIGRTTSALERLASTAEVGNGIVESRVFGRIEEAAQDAAQRIRGGAEEYAKALRDVGQAVRGSGLAVVNAHEEFAQTVEQTRGTLGEICRQFESMGRSATASFSATTESMGEAAKAALVASEAMTSAVEGIGRVAAGLGDIKGELDRIAQAVANVEEQLNAIRATSGQSATAIAQKATTDLQYIEQAMGNVRGATEMVRDGLLGLVSEIRRVVEPLK